MGHFIRLLSVLVIILSLSAHYLNAQSIKAQVTINMKQLYQEKQMELLGFDQTIKRYIESNNWSDGVIPFEIKVNLEITIDKIEPSFEDVYSARMFIASITTGFKEVDRRWRFPYQFNQTLIFDPIIFDGLTGLIDFYLYIIVGEYLDRRERFKGEMHFNTAYEISRMGQQDRYNRWWDRREEFVRQYLRESHKPFREMTRALETAHFWQLDKNEENKKLAADAAMELLKEVIKTPDEEEFIKDFFSREYANLAAVFASDSAHYNIIMNLDPEHKDFYSNFIKKKFLN